ncbi:hypothetical protein DFH06DRAFT_1344713 [Mycena polygramma]|nr:hypothetical protein DFH06DRAFT_1344713 [Mycena polygramma]
MTLPPGAVGATAMLASAQAVGSEAVQAENEEEVESMRAGFEMDERGAQGTNRPDNVPESPNKVAKIQQEEMSKHLKVASENVIVEGTRAEYRRLWNQFIEFCTLIGCFKPTEDVDKLFMKPPSEVPTWIALWIMNK